MGQRKSGRPPPGCKVDYSTGILCKVSATLRISDNAQGIRKLKPLHTGDTYAILRLCTESYLSDDIAPAKCAAHSGKIVAFSSLHFGA